VSTTHRAGPARRAVLRWAWRLFRREWRQQVVVLLLLTVGVAGAVAGATMTVNATTRDHGTGDAKGMAFLDGLSPDDAATRIAAARARFGPVDVITHDTVAVPGSVKQLDVRGEDPNGTFTGPLLALRTGRYPTTADEVALTDGAAALLGADVGDHVTLGHSTRTVVGRVENPSELDDEFALVPLDEHAAVPRRQLLLLDHRPSPGRAEGPPPASARADATPDLPIAFPGDDGPIAVLVLVAMTMAMALVGLIAAAAFVVVAHRRQRQLGVLAAIGAPQRQLRLVMVANGALVGATAALVGTVVGLLAWLASAPLIEHVANHRIDRLDLPWMLVGSCALLAIVMGTLAAWWPARTVARLPVMAALSGRPSSPRPVHRSVVVAVALLALGMAAIAIALPTGKEAEPLLLVAGMVAVIVGVVFASPAAIRAAAIPAARLPLAARIAVRDLARHQARASAALASMTLGLAIAVAVVGLAKASEYGEAEGNMSGRQLVVWAANRPTPDPFAKQAGAPPDATQATLDAEAAHIGTTIGSASVTPLDIALGAAPMAASGRDAPITEARPIGAHSFRYLSQPYVATPSLLARLGIDPSTIADGTELLTSRQGPTMLLDVTTRLDTAATTTTQHVDVPEYTSAPSSLITESALQRHGWRTARAGWLIESSTPLTATQIRAARAAAASAGLAIETRDQQGALGSIRRVATAAGALLALAIVAMTMGLLRGESTRDLQTLTATGASTMTRRTITASTAGFLAVLGVVLGTAGAYAALVAGYHGELDHLLPLPVSDLALLGIGLPVVAAAAGWLLAGHEPKTFARRTLE
jgi:putative ABC transport system permease protein